MVLSMSSTAEWERGRLSGAHYRRRASEPHPCCRESPCRRGATAVRTAAFPSPQPAMRRAVAASLVVALLPVQGSNHLPRYAPDALQSLAQKVRGEAKVQGLELPTPSPAGLCLAKLHATSCLTLLLYTPAEAANKLDSSMFSLLLRITDDSEHRKAEGYKRHWRKVLQTANLLQFLPNYEWLSAEAIATQPAEVAARPYI